MCQSVTWYCTPISVTLKLVAVQSLTGDPERAAQGQIPACSSFGPRYSMLTAT